MLMQISPNASSAFQTDFFESPEEKAICVRPCLPTTVSFLISSSGPPRSPSSASLAKVTVCRVQVTAPLLSHQTWGGMEVKPPRHSVKGARRCEAHVKRRGGLSCGPAAACAPVVATAAPRSGEQGIDVNVQAIGGETCPRRALDTERAH